jgi:hypothetical protein
VAERNDLELQNRAAVKPASAPGEERRDVCEHSGDTTAGQDKLLHFSTLSEFLVGTRDRCLESIRRKTSNLIFAEAVTGCCVRRLPFRIQYLVERLSLQFVFAWHRCQKFWGVRVRGSLQATGTAPLVGVAMNPGYRQEIETTNEFVRIKS